jgi:uncharacterized membrane protein
MDKTSLDQDPGVWQTTKRIETLADGIFAIAMTLLVLTIDVPNITGQISNTVILQNLIFLIPKLFAYALSFILLAIFWRVNHQQFYLIKRVNTTLLWINVLFLMLVVLVPFSTSLIGKYGNYQIPMIFFDLNMLLIGVFYNLNWFYAYKKNFLDESVYLDKMGPIRKVSLILPFASLIAIVLTFINPSLSVVAYFSIPFFKNFLKD